jgi:hypothetical protein
VYNCNNKIVVPDIAVYINCDTIIAINFKVLDLGEFDEVIFMLKNYDYIDAPYIYTFKARKSDADDRGEVVFKIPQVASRRLKPGAFYTLTVLTNALSTKKETIYTSLSERGNIILEYGRQDITVKPDEKLASDYEIISMRLEPLNTTDLPNSMAPIAEIVGLRLEPI